MHVAAAKLGLEFVVAKGDKCKLENLNELIY